MFDQLAGYGAEHWLLPWLGSAADANLLRSLSYGLLIIAALGFAVWYFLTGVLLQALRAEIVGQQPVADIWWLILVWPVVFPADACFLFCAFVDVIWRYVWSFAIPAAPPPVVDTAEWDGFL